MVGVFSFKFEHRGELSRFLMLRTGPKQNEADCVDSSLHLEVTAG